MEQDKNGLVKTINTLSNLIAGTAIFTGSVQGMLEIFRSTEKFFSGGNYEFFDPESWVPALIKSFTVAGISLIISVATRDPNLPPIEDE